MASVGRHNRFDEANEKPWQCSLTVVNHEGTVRVFECRVRCQNRVVRFNDSGRDLGSWVHGELEFRFLAVVNTETFHQERCEARASAT